MAQENLHKNIINSQRHDPKGFEDGNRASYPTKNFKDTLEWIDIYNHLPVDDIVDGALAPPVESEGQRYIIQELTTSVVHADWDGASFEDIVEYDQLTASVWNSVTPSRFFRADDKDSGSEYLFDGTTWNVVAGGGLSDVVDDTTPQLGGDLDVNGQSIVSVSNADINITPNGTGNVSLGNLVFDADQTVGAGQDGYSLQYHNPSNSLILANLNIVKDTTPQLGGNLDVNGNKITSVSNGDIDIEPNGTGNVLLGNFTFDADQTVGAGQDNYVLTYDDAAGTIGLEAATGGGGMSDLVDDTTPQLGGSLDVNGNKIVSVSNGDIDIEPNGTGNVLLGNMTFDADQTIGSGQDNYVLTYDHSAGVISLEAAAGGSSVFTNDAADNVFGGTQSGTALTGTSGQRCFFGGYRAGYLVTSGLYNVAIGDRAMSSAATTGSANVAIGSNASPSLTSGFSNVAIGREAGYALATAQHNIMIGHRAGNGVTGNRNICMGYYTGNNAGNDNTMIGVTSGSGSSFGDKNVMLGRTVANLGDGNVCIGYNVQQSGNVTGDGNIFIHTSYAGTSTYNAVSGSNNCVIGLDIEVPTGLSNYVSLYDLYRGDHSAGECYMACPSTAAADADLNNSEVHFSVDETLNTLGIKVKYSSGVVKTATVALT